MKSQNVKAYLKAIAIHSALVDALSLAHRELGTTRQRLTHEQYGTATFRVHIKSNPYVAAVRIRVTKQELPVEPSRQRDR